MSFGRADLRPPHQITFANDADKLAVLADNRRPTDVIVQQGVGDFANARGNAHCAVTPTVMTLDPIALLRPRRLSSRYLTKIKHDPRSTVLAPDMREMGIQADRPVRP
jgi:hypothetical protein